MTKLVLPGLLVAYHVACAFVIPGFRDKRNRHTHVYYRRYNGIPSLFLRAYSSAGRR
jgi:putative membrane protein